MTPRSQARPRPIPFAMPSRPPVELARGPVTPFAAAEAPPRNGPQPVHWGDAPGGALNMPAEDPRALYAVTRNWQGQAVPLDAAAQRPPTAHTAPAAKPPAPPLRAVNPTSTAAVTEVTARFVGQGSLCVRSSVTGRHYRFTGHGHTLRIDKHDQMLMRRISDVELG